MIVSIFLKKYPVNPLLLFLMNLPAILAYILWFWPRYVGTYQFQPRNWLFLFSVLFTVIMLLSYFVQHTLGLGQLPKQ